MWILLNAPYGSLGNYACFLYGNGNWGVGRGGWKGGVACLFLSARKIREAMMYAENLRWDMPVETKLGKGAKGKF